MNILKRIGLTVLLAAVLLTSFTNSSRAQLNADGKDFYVGLLYPSFMNQNISFFGRNVQGFYGAYLLISSYYNNAVTVSYFDDAGNEAFRQTYQVQARRAITVPLDISHTKMADQKGEVVEYKACHIVAKSAINVQYFSTGSCSGGSYLALPTNVLGKNYIVESYHDNPGGLGGVTSNEDAAGYFMVIGAFDGTSVEITPNTTTAKGRPGVNSGAGSNGFKQPFSISLNRGQCYMVKSTAGDISNDISGTSVISSKPVAVIAGHENAFTDGSDIGSITLEARDYMIEQMIPCEYWDTTGYVSIPFVDSKQPAPGGEGDEYHVFTCSPTGANITMNSNIQRDVSLATSLYPNPVPSKVGVTTPTNFYETYPGGKFHVMMYDQRMQGAGAPYPAPSMMSIVPISRWKTSYLWSVPANTFEILQGYFINVLCRKADYDKDKIQIAVNGGKLASIRASGLSVKKIWGAGTIPDHPDLMGVTFAIGPGAYYATSLSTGPDAGFMIYNYGFRAIDPDRDLGDFCGDDHFFGYALPIGFLGGTGDSTKLTVTVDTLCAKWHVCAHVRGKNQPGIKQISILDDPNGDVVRPGRQFHNVFFDPAVDPDNTRELNLPGNDSDYCVDIYVKNPLDTGYCPLYIVDNNGNDYLVELRYKSPKLQLVIKPNFPNGSDSIIYPPTGVGDEVCATLYYINNGDSAKGDPNVSIVSSDLKKGNVGFTVTKTVPGLPVTLNPARKNRAGDTLAITVCFDPKDTAVHIDSLLFTTDCFKAPVTLVGPGGTPLIYASDHDYGTVVVGDTKCDTVSVKNVGNLPFTLTVNYLLHDLINFSIDPTDAAKLPVILKPGEKFIVHFCFAPKVVGPDSTTNDWKTDIKAPYTDQIKSWSYLKGIGVKPGVIWDRIVQADTTTCSDTTVRRVYLSNHQTSETYVYQVFFDGADAAEYSLAPSQVYSPLDGFPMLKDATIPVDYILRPNVTKGFADRHARLIASYYRDTKHTILDSTIIDLTGVILHPAVTANPTLLDFGVVGVGQPNSLITTLSSTGTAPYILSAIDFKSPVIDILRDSNKLQIGDTLYPGQLVSITVQTQLDYVGDTTVPIIFKDTKCGNDLTVLVHILASRTDLQGTGWPAPVTFTCRDISSTVKATNRSAIPYTLKEVDIVSTGIYPNATEFDFIDVKKGGALSKTIIVDSLVQVKGTVVFPVQYHPTLRGPASAQVRYIWDSAGKKSDTVYNILSGTGAQVHTTLTAAKDDVMPVAYNNITGENITVPIRFTGLDTLPANADVRRVTFDVRYKADLFAYLGVQSPAGYTATGGTRVTSVMGGINMETLPLNVTSVAPIANLDKVALIDLQVMIAKDVSSDFVISNVKFYDGAGQFICYAAADTIPGLFNPNPSCADTTLRDYLNLKLPTRIISVSPNVISDNTDPILTYKVMQYDVQVKVEVFNMLGQKISAPRYMNASSLGEHRLPINIQGFKSGTYTVRLSTPTTTQTAQFVLHK